MTEKLTKEELNKLIDMIEDNSFYRESVKFELTPEMIAMFKKQPEWKYYEEEE